MNMLPCLLVPISIGLFAPIPDDVSPMDCLCTFNAYSTSTVPSDRTPNSDPTVTVTFSPDAKSGKCDGFSDPCPTIGECEGEARLLVIAKPFTQMGEGPGAVFGIDNFGTYELEDSVTGCGFALQMWLTVFGITGTNLGEVKLVIRCTRCSDTE